MFGKDKNHWFYKAEKLYKRGKMRSPYKTLFEYSMSISCVTKHKLFGHYDFFRDAEIRSELDNIVKELASVLPIDLLNNFNTAFENYKTLGEDPDYDDIEKLLYPLDDYAFDREEEMATILQNYIEMNESL